MCDIVGQAVVPMSSTLAYRFDTDDGSAAFSSETGPSENLIDLAHVADVLVHEAIDTGWADELLPLPRRAAQEALFQHLVGAHTVERATAVARAARVGTLVLSPLIPGNRPRKRLQCARGAFAGRILIGEDLMALDVAATRR